MGADLRIAIDVRPLGLDAVTGVGLVIQLILEELQGRGASFVGITNRQPPPGRISPLIPIVPDPDPPGRIRWESRTLPRLLRGLEPAPDLYHATWNHGLPGRLPFPAILTIFDLIPWRFPEEVPWPKPRLLHRALYRRAVRASARAAGTIVTSSEASRRDISTLLAGRAAENAEVIPIPLPRWFPRRQPAGQVRNPVPGAYWLYVGGFDPRKGIRTLLLAMRAAFPTPSAAPELVLAGAINDHAKEMQSLARDLGVAARFPGYVPDADLPALFERASLFIYPSRHEGFGIPILFALAAGVPVIASDGGSLPEVVGDAGLLFPAGDHDALAGILARARSQPGSLAPYAARGLVRVQDFSPDAFRERMLRVYERAAGRRAEYE